MFTPVWTDTKIAQPSAPGDWAPGAYDPAIRLSVLHHRSLHAQIQPHRPHFGSRYARVRADHRARFAHQQTGLAEGSPVSGRLRQRSAGHRRRPAVPWRHGRISSAHSIRKTGEELWRFQTGFGADAPAATYEIGGEQYVAIAAGGSRDGYKEAQRRSGLELQARRPAESVERTTGAADRHRHRIGAQPSRGVGVSIIGA